MHRIEIDTTVLAEISGYEGGTVLMLLCIFR